MNMYTIVFSHNRTARLFTQCHVHMPHSRLSPGERTAEDMNSFISKKQSSKFYITGSSYTASANTPTHKHSQIQVGDQIKEK